MTCTGGSGCKHFTPPSVRCSNAGSGYSDADVQWTCTASLPPEVKLGATDVVCEGFDSADDEAVLRGSCALEYRLLLTDAGAAKFGSGGSSWVSSGDKDGEGDVLLASVFWIIFIGMLGFIAYRFWTQWTADRRAGRPFRFGDGGGGGGWGGGNDDDPPPPYDPRPPPAPRYAKQSRAGPSTSGWGGGGRTAQAQQQGWRPGFWTGTAAGAAAGYFAGQRGSGRREMQERRYDPGEGSSSRPFGGGSSMSSERYESTGFGGTRRR